MEKGLIKMGSNPRKLLLKHFFGQHWQLTFGALIAGLMANLATLFVSISIGKYYQLVIGTESPRGRVFDMLLFDISSLNSFFYWFVMLIFVHFGASFTVRFLADLSGERLVKVLRETLFSCHMSTTIKNFHRPAGRQLLQYSSDMGSVKRLVSKGILGATIDLLLLVLGFGLLFSLNVSLAALITFMGLAAAIFLIIINHHLMKGNAVFRRQRSSNLNFVSKRLLALFTVQLMQRNEKETNKFIRRSDKLYQKVKRWLMQENLQKAAVPFTMYCLLLAVLVYGAYLVQLEDQRVEAPILLVFIMFLLSIIPAFRRLLYTQRHWHDGWISLHKITTKLDGAKLKNQGIALPPLTQGKLNIRSFTKNLEYGRCLYFPDIEAQKSRIGYWKAPTGSGKSQLLLMVAGVVPCPPASIYIDGHDLADMNPASLRDQIGLFTPDAPLLGNTLAGVLGNPKGEKLERATVLLTQFGFPVVKGQSLKIEIGDGGSLLSTGEVRKLQLVRTLINPRPIMLFDDPYTNLEDASVSHLNDILNKLKNDCTILMVISAKTEMCADSGEWFPDGVSEKSHTSAQKLNLLATSDNLEILKNFKNI